eukprot:5145624-Lingulodinium_polyedra.AAC.1
MGDAGRPHRAGGRGRFLGGFWPRSGSATRCGPARRGSVGSTVSGPPLPRPGWAVGLRPPKRPPAIVS